ncbi:DNA primase regulatory subunit PriL, partial [Candidatus Bathyarchaeota archaeon]
MRTGVLGLTRLDLAKYPFLREASRHVSDLGLDVRDLLAPGLSKVLDRALSRILEAVRFGKVLPDLSDEEVEILSFPVAIMMVSSVRSDFLVKRYALAEARRAEELLSSEPPDKVMLIAGDLGWSIRQVEVRVGDVLYEFSLGLIDYLRNASGMKDKKWKLVNRLVLHGEVLITRPEAARLLAEEVRRRVEELIRRSSGKLKGPPGVLAPYLERVREAMSELELEGAPRLEEAGEVIFEAFPPCMKAIYGALTEKKHVPHVGRFAFTAFLLHVGMGVDEVVDLFRQVSDFSERITRYQVEHIAGERGGKTRYTPPSCSTMRSYGLCVGADELCRKIRHPLSY